MPTTELMLLHLLLILSYKKSLAKDSDISRHCQLKPQQIVPSQHQAPFCTLPSKCLSELVIQTWVFTCCVLRPDRPNASPRVACLPRAESGAVGAREPALPCAADVGREDEGPGAPMSSSASIAAMPLG